MSLSKQPISVEIAPVEGTAGRSGNMDGLRIVQEDNVGNGTEQRKGLRAQRNARPKQNVCEECSCGLCKQASKAMGFHRWSAQSDALGMLHSYLRLAQKCCAQLSYVVWTSYHIKRARIVFAPEKSAQPRPLVRLVSGLRPKLVVGMPGGGRSAILKS